MMASALAIMSHLPVSLHPLSPGTWLKRTLTRAASRLDTRVPPPNTRGTVPTGTARAGGSAGRSRSSGPNAGLTSRERQVAVLIMRGYTNKQIAATLVIAEGTAERHVANIFRKLGFSCRAQVATWATEQGL